MSPKKVTEDTYAPLTLFGKFLHQELLESGLPIRDFAKQIGMNRQTVTRFLETKTEPSLDMLLTISQRMGVNLVMLIILARPESAPALMRQQRRVPNAIEARLINGHLLPQTIEYSIDTILTAEVEESVHDALMVLDNTAYLMARSDADKEQLLAAHDRAITRILSILGRER